MKEQEPNEKEAATFKIKNYPLGDWRTKVTDIDFNGAWEQTVLHDVPLAEIFDRETISRLSAQKAKGEKNQ